MKTVRPCPVTLASVVLFFSLSGSIAAKDDGGTVSGSAPGTRSVPGKDKVRKCCEVDLAYDPVTRYCRKTSQNVSGIFPWLLTRSIDRTTIPYAHKWLYCDNVLADVPADELQRLLDDVSGTGEQGLLKDRCFDLKWSAAGENNEDQLVARKCKPYDDHCRGNVTCVKKCCRRENKMFVNNSCVVTEIPFQYPIHEISDHGTFTPSNNTLVTYYRAPPCLNYIVESDFKLASNGSLYLTDTGTYLPQSEFCMENYQPTAGDPQFSAFVCKIEYSRRQEDPNDEGHGNLKYYALLAGHIHSAVCLFLTLLVYSVLPTLRDVHGYCVMCYVTCMFVSVMCLMVIQWLKNIIGKNMCSFFGYATLFGSLATFCWLSVICFDVYWTLRRNCSINRSKNLHYHTIAYHIYCWGFSSIYLIMAFVFQYSENKLLVKLSPKIGISSCWFEKGEYGFSIFYITPVTIMIVSNIIMFVLTAIRCAKITSRINRFKKNYYQNERFQAEKEKIAVAIKLFLVMGLPLIFVMLNKAFPKSWDMLTTFDLITAHQGVMIFFILVLKKNVMSGLWCKFGYSITRTPSVSAKSNMLQDNNYF